MFILRPGKHKACHHSNRPIIMIPQHTIPTATTPWLRVIKENLSPVLAYMIRTAWPAIRAKSHLVLLCMGVAFVAFIVSDVLLTPVVIVRDALRRLLCGRRSKRSSLV